MADEQPAEPAKESEAMRQRRERQAAALRANLRRRKQAARDKEGAGEG